MSEFTTYGIRSKRRSAIVPMAYSTVKDYTTAQPWFARAPLQCNVIPLSRSYRQLNIPRLGVSAIEIDDELYIAARPAVFMPLARV